VLDKREAKNFVNMILKTMYGEGKYSLAKFSSWFDQFDKNHDGAIQKDEFLNFITKVSKTEMFGARDQSAHQEQIVDGRHHIKKLVNLYRLNQLDYLHLCDLTRKIYRCFDLDGNANLDKFETRNLMEAFSSEMNTIGTQFNKQTFKKFFQ
jgi:Ca2+-binding EF-hand superfamily protein